MIGHFFRTEFGDVCEEDPRVCKCATVNLVAPGAQTCHNAARAGSKPLDRGSLQLRADDDYSIDITVLLDQRVHFGSTQFLFARFKWNRGNAVEAQGVKFCLRRWELDWVQSNHSGRFPHAFPLLHASARVAGPLHDQQYLVQL